MAIVIHSVVFFGRKTTKNNVFTELFMTFYAKEPAIIDDITYQYVFIDLHRNFKA